MVSVEFEERVDPAVNILAVSLDAALRRVMLCGVRDIVTSYRAVAVYFDPIRTSLEKLVSEIERLASCKPEGSSSQRLPIEIPVCYGGEYGPDLLKVAEYLGYSVSEVVDRHTKPIYLVYMVGFLPGFAYMGNTDTKIDIPRHQTPRVRVPACSVGLAGRQTGIYPMEMPGGWQLIGRTSLKPFDLSRADPFLFKPGDHIRFFSVTSERYRDGCISPS
jgi:KipI family sensor histidine kinase inhibitor